MNLTVRRRHRRISFAVFVIAGVGFAAGLAARIPDGASQDLPAALTEAPRLPEIAPPPDAAAAADTVAASETGTVKP